VSDSARGVPVNMNIRVAPMAFQNCLSRIEHRNPARTQKKAPIGPPEQRALTDWISRLGKPILGDSNGATGDLIAAEKRATALRLRVFGDHLPDQRSAPCARPRGRPANSPQNLSEVVPSPAIRFADSTQKGRPIEWAPENHGND